MPDAADERASLWFTAPDRAQDVPPVIDLDDVIAFCRTRRRLHAAVHARIDQFQPRRDWSEGLERYVEVEREPWSFIRTREGWQFTCRRTGVLVPIRSDGRGAEGFSSSDLTHWLRSRHEERYTGLTELAVENWLTRAWSRGEIQSLPDPPGYFVPA